MEEMPLSTFLKTARYRGKIVGLRFPGGLSGLFGGIELDLFVMARQPKEERRWVTVLCTGVFDYSLAPDYSLIEGMPDIELTRFDALLDPTRLARLWCEENEPEVDKGVLSLLCCGRGYVIATEFVVSPSSRDRSRES